MGREKLENFAVIVLMFSSAILRITTGGSGFQDGCFESCTKLVRETVEDDGDKKCAKMQKTDTLYEEKKSCRLICENVISNNTVSSRGEDFVDVPSSPLQHNATYTSITLRWSTSSNASRNVAFYILHAQSNVSAKNLLEILPSISRYVMVKPTNYTKRQTFTVANLDNGSGYKFRVAAVGLNGKSSEYSDWSSWYSTSSYCERTNGTIIDIFFGDEKKVQFPCPISGIELNVSIKAADKKPVVLDATMTWKNPPGMHLLNGCTVRVSVKRLKHKDEKIDEMCAHYHDTDFEKQFHPETNFSAFHLFSGDMGHGIPKQSIHFGCSYVVKFEVVDAERPNSFETTTTFNIPECLQGVTSCPVPKIKPLIDDEISDVISENIFARGNSSYATNISWNAEVWFKLHKIEFFHVTLDEYPPGSFYYTEDVPAKDGVTVYHAVSNGMSEGKEYLATVRAYHGLNCIHNIVESKRFQIHKPCGQGCTTNATCWPMDVYDGTAVCRCKAGYTGNGTLCTGIVIHTPCGKGCTTNATCWPMDVYDGTAACRCKAGYTGNGTLCTGIVIHTPCGKGCTTNATCWPMDVYDGTAACRCKAGYTGNGTLCTAIDLGRPISSPKADKNINVLAIVIPITFLLALMALILALVWRVKRKKVMVLNAIEAHESAISPSSSNTNLYQHCPPLQSRHNHDEISSKENQVELEEKEVNVIYVPQEIQDAISRGLTDGYEFNAEQIKFEECLGKGAFGYVHRARALGITAEPEWTQVAVKTLSEPVTDKSVEDFIGEIELMKKLGEHENIIQMFGCCTVTSPVCLIMEYAPYGNLLTYLRTVKSQVVEKDLMKKDSVPEKLSQDENSLSKEHNGVEPESIHLKLFPETDDLLCKNCTYLESFALQIANGMRYVVGRGIVHRDLAARNILIGGDGKLKISDFGLSKEGVYVKSTSGKIPLRWLSIEAIRERMYSSASDVWSFGIVLWEICTLGGFPYPTVSDRELLKFLVSGERLEKPSNCTDEMYAIMLDCWESVPEDRPTFSHLRDVLWKTNTGENPYINIGPMQDDSPSTADQGESVENSIVA